MSVTDKIAEKAKDIQVNKDYEPFTLKPGPADLNFSMFNPGGVCVEEGELLYSLVRMIKPDLIFDSGTYMGISATYMAMGLKENGKGKIITTEPHIPSVKEAQKLFKALEIESFIEISEKRTENYEVSGRKFDMVFLDSEPLLRFNELIQLWPYINPGGIIGIHDLDQTMGQSGPLKEIWPKINKRVEKLILSHELQSLHFKTPHGMYIGQKAPLGSYTKLIMDEG